MSKYEKYLTEARGKLFPDDCKVGSTYTVGYRSDKWDATFEGWEIKNNLPRMKWTDEEVGEWDAYMFEGKMSVGSSADPLIIYAEVK